MSKIIRGLKNASYLTIGNVFTAIISLAGSIFIARKLGPTNYGELNTAMAFIGMFGALSLGGLNKVVIREGSKDLKKLGLILNQTTGIKNLFAFIAVLSCIIGSFFAPYDTQLRIYIAIVSFDLVYRSFNGYLGTIYKSHEQMKYDAFINFLARFLYVTFAVIFVYIGFGVLALVIILVMSHLITLLINFQVTKKFVSFQFWNKIVWEKSLIKPAIVFSIIAFVSGLSSKIDLVMISWMKSSYEVGIYAIPFQITNQMQMLRGVTAVAFFPIFVKTFHEKTVNAKKFLKYAFGIGFSMLIVAGIISLFSKEIVLILYGDQYQYSGKILGVLVFYVAITFFSLPFTNALQATHNENLLMKIVWIAPLLKITLNYFFINKYGVIGVAYSTLITYSVHLGLFSILTYYVLKSQKRIK